MNQPDARFPAALPNAPYQITKYVPYDQIHGAFKACDAGAYVGDPLHRFYQMNQQTNQNQNKLFVWTADTAGDSNGAPPADTDQGAVSMGYYNYRVFGNAFTPPYFVNRATYAVAPHFLWQAARPEPVYRHRVLRQFYTAWEMECYRDARADRPPRGWFDKAKTYWRFYLGPVGGLLLDHLDDGRSAKG